MPKSCSVILSTGSCQRLVVFLLAANESLLFLDLLILRVKNVTSFLSVIRIKNSIDHFFFCLLSILCHRIFSFPIGLFILFFWDLKTFRCNHYYPLVMFVVFNNKCFLIHSH